MNLAMKYYMEKKRAHDEFIEKERAEFELGKRHLANMMGDKSAEEMTQEDIDKAVEYLFPVGLYERSANPLMKPPEEVSKEEQPINFFQFFDFTLPIHSTNLASAKLRRSMEASLFCGK